MSDGVTITCGRCRQTHPFELWKGPPEAPLAPDTFACPTPGCHFAFRRIARPDAKWPEKSVIIQPIHAELPFVKPDGPAKKPFNIDKLTDTSEPQRLNAVILPHAGQLLITTTPS